MRFPTDATDPHGAVLSAAADQTRSAGHINAAGPISSAAETDVATRAKVARKDVAETILRFESSFLNIVAEIAETETEQIEREQLEGGRVEESPSPNIPKAASGVFAKFPSSLHGSRGLGGTMQHPEE